MAIENFLSPDAVRNLAIEEAGNALKNLNAQIVNEQTFEVKSQVDAQTYDATNDFQKQVYLERSRKAKLEALSDPDPMELANTLLAEVASLTGDERVAFLRENKERIADIIKSLGDKAGKVVDKTNELNNEASKASATKGKDAANRIYAYAKKLSLESRRIYAKQTSMEDLQKKASIPTKEDIAAERAKLNPADIVDSYENIAGTPNLSKLVEEMQMSFKEKKIGADRVQLQFFINEVYTSFKADTKHVVSYEITLAPADESGISNAIIIDLLAKDGKHYLKKFALESGKVEEYDRWEDEKWSDIQETYELAKEDLKSREKVSMVNN